MLRVLLLSLAGLSFIACSGGGGGGGGGSSTTGTASGVLALPAANCASSACLQSTGYEISAVSPGGSAEVLLENADYAYKYVRNEFVPLINQKMYAVEKAFESEGYTACGGSVTGSDGKPQMDQIPDGTYPLNSEYSVTVSAGDKTAPYTTEKKFILSKNLAAFLEVQVGCPNATTRAIYIRVKEGSNYYEAWGYQDVSSKVIFAASDVGTEKRTLYFKATSGVVFEVAAVLKNATLPNVGSPQTLAISGGANWLGAQGKLDVQFLTNGATALTASGGTYDTDNSGGVVGNTRHCYTDVDNVTITTTASQCTGLFAGPAAVYLRGGSQSLTNWSVNSIGSASIGTSF